MEALTMVNFIRVLFSGLLSETLMRSLNLCRSNKFLIFSLCFFIGFSISVNDQHADAQITPIPPPAQQPKATPLHLEPGQLKNDTNSPTLEVLTKSLIEGGNVFRVKITDEAPITTAQVTFVQNGQLVTQGLVRDPNNIYKALIYVHSPSAVVVSSAFDVHGKTASVVKYLNVTPLSKSIQAQITNFFFGIGKSIVSIFGFTK
ncbi:MAG TPA: hypothetical protein VFI70_04725 [Nitrososphaeraceae archaeon]|nr:hypothetical protein [Nitrososphaeraceae archaeon]